MPVIPDFEYLDKNNNSVTFHFETRGAIWRMIYTLLTVLFWSFVPDEAEDTTHAM